MAEGRGGVVKKFLGHTTPSARANAASRLSLDRASTPPPAEEGSRLLKLSKALRNLDTIRPTLRLPDEIFIKPTPAQAAMLQGRFGGFSFDVLPLHG